MDNTGRGQRQRRDIRQADGGAINFHDKRAPQLADREGHGDGALSAERLTFIIGSLPV